MHDDSPTEDAHRIPPQVLARARELRHGQTPAERKLWAVLRGNQLQGLKFRRQHPMGRCIADFYCAEFTSQDVQRNLEGVVLAIRQACGA